MSHPPRHGSPRREAAWVVAFTVLLSAVLTWPLVLHPFTRLAAPTGPGDPSLNLWILGWDLGTIARDPLALVTGRIFDANIFFPAEGTLAYSDHLILQALALFPLYLATGNLTFCYKRAAARVAGRLHALDVCVRARRDGLARGARSWPGWRGDSCRSTSRTCCICNCSRSTGCPSRSSASID